MAGRALQLCSYVAPYRGAFITQLLVLERELQARGWRPGAYVFPQGASGLDWLDSFGELGCDVHFVARPGRLRGVRRAAAEVARIARAAGATVLHSHFGRYDLAAARAGRATGARVVWHYRAAAPWSGGHRPVRAAVSDFFRYRLWSRKVALCVALNDDMAREMRRRGMQAPVIALDAGIDVDRYATSGGERAAVRAELGVADDDLMLLHMGWEWHRKGGDVLTGAVHALAQPSARQLLDEAGVDQVRVFSVGAGDAAEPPVEPLDPVEHIERLHAAADIFVATSRSEAFGNALAEAMASRRVAVATDIAGQATLVRGLPGVIAVPAADVGATLSALLYLVARRQQWGELGDANLAYVREHHDVANWAVAMAGEYERLTAR